MARDRKKWTPTSIHRVVSEFLLGERQGVADLYPPWLPIVDDPHLDDPLENHKRLRLLLIRRGVFMVEIPPDTQWYEVQFTEKDIKRLYVSAKHNPDWDRPGNRLDQVAATLRPEPAPLTAPPDKWAACIILWGHKRSGPFTIIEGNHRMLSWAHTKPRPPLKITALVGISLSYCHWHFEDPRVSLGQGLHNLTPAAVPINDWLYIDPLHARC
jgi:hypothetical protein